MARFTASDGCRIHYEVSGAGEPVVLVPGLGGDGRFWSSVASALQSGFRVAAVDHRGAGRSDEPLSGYSIARIAADVAGIIEQEGLPRAHLVGHSTGGAVAQVLALTEPERFLSCTISSSWLKPDARFRMLFELRKSLLQDGRFEDYQHLTHVLGYPSQWIEDHAEELARAVAAANTVLSPAEVQMARIDMLLAHDCERDLGRMTVPVLVIGAADDALLPVEYSERVAAAIPGARLLTVRGGHFHPRTEPHQFARVWRSFVDMLKPSELPQDRR
jgi:aminoacrylate hydrolase